MKWISIEDKMPDDSIRVLGFNPNTYPEIDICYYINKERGWNWARSSGGPQRKLNTPSHWTPLLEKPKTKKP